MATASGNTALLNALLLQAQSLPEGGGGIRKVVVDIVPENDLNITASATLTAQTGVDAIPDVMIMFCPDMDEWIAAHADSLPTTNTITGAVYFRLPVPFVQIYTSTNKGTAPGEFFVAGASILSAETDAFFFGVLTSPTYNAVTTGSGTNKIEKGVVKIPYISNSRYARAGLTYRFICLYGIN